MESSIFREAPKKGPALRGCWPVWVLTWCLLGELWAGLVSWAPASPSPAGHCFSHLAGNLEQRSRK